MLKVLSQFQAIGQALFTQGLVSPQGGNLSVKLGERLVITHRGSALGYIQEGDLVETGINKNNRVTPRASTELEVHRCIYKNTAALAVVHAHPPYAVALSFTEKEIVPPDIEGRALLSRVPVLRTRAKGKAREFTDEIAKLLGEHRVVLVRGHGTFAASQLLEEAYYYTVVLEQSCRLLYLLKALQINPGIIPV
ncbi:MAG TPA: aldolase [Dehalococcoidia bacterium]|nr:aldolase [Dehalococcoidia bacterium]